MLDHGSSSNYQHATQSFVAGSRDNAGPDPACGRMIPRCQADPGSKLSPRSKHLRRRGLHFQQRRADRADAGNLDEPSATFIGAMPIYELGIDLVDLRLQLRIFLGQSRDQLPSQGGQTLIDADALEQRIEVSLPFGGYKTERTRMAPNGVAQLRAIADQPVTDADQHQGGLLLRRFHRDEAHCRPAHRLAKRFSIRRVILAALDIRFDQLRRDQLHRMPERLQKPCTMMARTAGFDRNYCRRKPLEKCKHLLASPLLP